MSTLTLKFANNVNISAQVGDIAYYVPVIEAAADAGKVQTATGYSNIVKMGPIEHINKNIVVITHDDNVSIPNANSEFIMFSKDNAANLSSLLGYYADIKFVNKSTDKAEIFSIGCEVFESSK